MSCGGGGGGGPDSDIPISKVPTENVLEDESASNLFPILDPVSYTHLTLPTNREV